MSRPAFQFLDPGPLRDGELQLVAPDVRLVDAMLAAANHPLTLATEPNDPRFTRQQLTDYLAVSPDGRVQGDAPGRVPYYDFWMYLHDVPPREPGDAHLTPMVRIAGKIALRISDTRVTEMYYGHIGYHVFPPARGHHYAERACRLLLPLARRHGMQTLWLTCNPANAASRRTCERLGAKYVETVDVPKNDPLYARGEHQKCRYRLEL